MKKLHPWETSAEDENLKPDEKNVHYVCIFSNRKLRSHASFSRECHNKRDGSNHTTAKV
ncbi:hypothetical protein [Parabacteroides distasonis]|uniref:hypothetical protein n=1 Tax=Parabacteroides distasonis TaxID=823 RepID=UPI001F0EF564|nr:hypothetical protein [Parabacteroides distasonis]